MNEGRRDTSPESGRSLSQQGAPVTRLVDDRLDVSADAHLAYLGDDLAMGARRLLMIAGLMTVLVIGVFGWDIGGVVIWTPVGGVIWGSVAFLLDIRTRVPTGRLREAPEDFTVSQPRDSDGLLLRLGYVLFAIASCLGLAWYADQWDLGPVFAPGQFVGYASASALGALLVGRWERAAGRRVLFDSSTDDHEPNLYAGPIARDAGG